MYNSEKLAFYRRHNVSHIFQEYNLLDDLTVKENILLGMDDKSQKKYQDDLMKVSKSIHVSISKQTNDYIPFSTNIFVFVAGFVLILICYELIVTCFKLQMSKKLKSITVDQRS